MSALHFELLQTSKSKNCQVHESKELEYFVKRQGLFNLFTASTIADKFLTRKRNRKRPPLFPLTPHILSKNLRRFCLFGRSKFLEHFGQRVV